jgi:hypothetical protein
MLAAALLMVVIGCIIIAFSALLSEIACRRVIRLLNAIARLNDKDIQEVQRHRKGLHRSTKKGRNEV